jgi:Mn-dependent DtxR family transcriptional regulator
MGRDYHETLQVLVKSKSEMSTAQVAERLHWDGGITAINNRLSDLERMGFLTRRRSGRVWLYKAIS